MAGKIGEGSLRAAFRQGGKEFTQTLQALPSGPVQQVDEPGTFWSATPQEVSLQTGAYDRMQDRRPKAMELER
jgi:hypothetical protein